MKNLYAIIFSVFIFCSISSGQIIDKKKTNDVKGLDSLVVNINLDSLKSWLQLNLVLAPAEVRISNAFPDYYLLMDNAGKYFLDAEGAYFLVRREEKEE